MTPQRAFDLGLINEVVPTGSALDVAKAMAVKIAANGPLAVAASKQVIDKAHDWTAQEMFAEQGKIVDPVFNSEDAIEGATAFAEKRAPIWKGK
jgi:enoyl-CoA hydratase